MGDQDDQIRLICTPSPRGRRYGKLSVIGIDLIGVDPHKGSHTAMAFGADEAPLGQVRVRASAAFQARGIADGEQRGGRFGRARISQRAGGRVLDWSWDFVGQHWRGHAASQRGHDRLPGDCA